MATMEQYIEQWALQKRAEFSMTPQEGIRIWNTIQTRLPSQTTHPIHWLRWSFLVPAFATMAVVFAVYRNSPEPPAIVAEDVSAVQTESIESAQEVASVPAAPTLQAASIILPRTSQSAARKLVASRGQSVFNPWGVSVFSPQNLQEQGTIDPRSLWAPSVF